MAPSLREALDRYLHNHATIDLKSFVLDRRAQEPPMSWQAIANDIKEATDDIFDVSWESLRTWAMDWTEDAA